MKKNFIVHSDTSVTVKPPKNSAYAQNKQSLQTLTNTIFQFSYVFQPEISQKEFFTATIFPCFEKFFKGENLLIFSYGVTNSVKTYTMQGTNNNPGLIPRTLDVIFNAIKDNMETKKLIYRYKPDRFNEICALTEAELNQEMSHKETLLRLATNRVSLQSCVASNCQLLKFFSFVFAARKWNESSHSSPSRTLMAPSALLKCRKSSALWTVCFSLFDQVYC